MSSAGVPILVKPTFETVITLVDNLDEREFSRVAEAIRERARQRACDAWDRMRVSARKGGLRKRDFEDAIKQVRARKRKRHAPTTRRA